MGSWTILSSASEDEEDEDELDEELEEEPEVIALFNRKYEVNGLDFPLDFGGSSLGSVKGSWIFSFLKIVK